uniref:TIGR00269 family protein n=1 Tax=Thermofilum pendens TaxID=2269 RepID=A0A7C3SKV2_THEPE
MLHALWRLRERLGVELVGVTIDLGIRGYSEEYVGVAVENFEQLGVPYRVVRLADYGFTIDEATRLRRPVCSVCGTVKRYLLNKVARELGAHVVATGHTLDDFLSVLLQAYIRGDLELLSKHKPYLPPADGLVARAKPLSETPERDTLTYARILGLRFTGRKCPYSRRAVSADYKASLDLLEERHPGLKFQMLRSFLDRVQPRIAAEARGGLGRCEACGEPSSSRVCQFCRFRAQLAGAPLRPAEVT